MMRHHKVMIASFVSAASKKAMVEAPLIVDVGVVSHVDINFMRHAYLSGSGSQTSVLFAGPRLASSEEIGAIDERS